MKERPMIFSAESVRAILAGRKTQTRRVAPHFPDGVRPEAVTWNPYNRVIQCHHSGIIVKCPYGQPGDRLWVRETWNHSHSAGELGGREIYYKADGDGYFGQWKSSMFMPRWASRLTLEVVNVRVERLHDITPDDAYCEGVEPVITNAEPDCLTPYRELWDNLNAKRGFPWASNPWVWVIEFRMVER